MFRHLKQQLTVQYIFCFCIIRQSLFLSTPAIYTRTAATCPISLNLVLTLKTVYCFCYFYLVDVFSVTNHLFCTLAPHMDCYIECVCVQFIVMTFRYGTSTLLDCWFFNKTFCIINVSSLLCN